MALALSFVLPFLTAATEPAAGLGSVPEASTTSGGLTAEVAGAPAVPASQAAGAMAADPLQPGPGADDCWLAPNEMSLTEYVYGNGDRGYVEQGGRRYCLRRLNADMLRFQPQSRVVGRTRFGRLQLFGQPLAYGVDIVLKPGDGTSPDLVYATPAVDLPEPWALTLEKVTAPIAVVGSVAIITTVLVELFRK